VPVSALVDDRTRASRICCSLRTVVEEAMAERVLRGDEPYTKSLTDRPVKLGVLPDRETAIIIKGRTRIKGLQRAVERGMVMPTRGVLCTVIEVADEMEADVMRATLPCDGESVRHLSALEHFEEAIKFLMVCVAGKKGQARLDAWRDGLTKLGQKWRDDTLRSKRFGANTTAHRAVYGGDADATRDLGTLFADGRAEGAVLVKEHLTKKSKVYTDAALTAFSKFLTSEQRTRALELMRDHHGRSLTMADVELCAQPGRVQPSRRGTEPGQVARYTGMCGGPQRSRRGSATRGDPTAAAEQPAQFTVTAEQRAQPAAAAEQRAHPTAAAEQPAQPAAAAEQTAQPAAAAEQPTHPTAAAEQPAQPAVAEQPAQPAAAAEQPTHPTAASEEPTHPTAAAEQLAQPAAAEQQAQPTAAAEQPTHPTAAAEQPAQPAAAAEQPTHPTAAAEQPAQPAAAAEQPTHPTAAAEQPAQPAAAAEQPAQPAAAAEQPTHPTAAAEQPAQPAAAPEQLVHPPSWTDVADRVEHRTPPPSPRNSDPITPDRPCMPIPRATASAAAFQNAVLGLSCQTALGAAFPADARQQQLEAVHAHEDLKMQLQASRELAERRRVEIERQRGEIERLRRLDLEVDVDALWLSGGAPSLELHTLEVAKICDEREQQPDDEEHWLDHQYATSCNPLLRQVQFMRRWEEDLRRREAKLQRSEAADRLRNKKRKAEDRDMAAKLIF